MDTFDLRGTYGGQIVTIRSIKPAERIPRVVVLIDTSGSMRDNEMAAALLAERFVSKLPPETEIGLAFFGTDFTPMAALSNDRSKLTLALESLKRGQYYAEGLTALWSAVGQAEKMFGKPLPGDSIYLISDGGDNRSVAHLHDAYERLAISGIRLFGVAFSSPLGIRSRTPEEMNGPGSIREAVRATGGTLLSDPDNTGYPYSSLDLVDKNAKPTKFAEDLTRQVAQIVNYYRLELTLPEPVRKPQSWKLSAAGNEPQKSQKLVLIYPTLLTPCP